MNGKVFVFNLFARPTNEGFSRIISYGLTICWACSAAWSPVAASVWIMTTLPQMLRMMLGVALTPVAVTSAGLATSLVGESLLRLSRFPPPLDLSAVSVLRLVSATRMTHAGWKARPGMLLTSKVRTLSMESDDAEAEQAHKD